LQFVLKELRESLYWLKVIQKTEILPRADAHLEKGLQEAKELANIIAKSIVSAKSK